MAVTFSDLHSEAGLKSLESYLTGKTYISGNEITKDDVKVYAAVLDKPNSDLYPCASKWFLSVAAKLATSFPGKAVGVSISAQASSTEAAPVKEAAKGTDNRSLLNRSKKDNQFLKLGSCCRRDDESDLWMRRGGEKEAAEARDQAKHHTKKKEMFGGNHQGFLWRVKPWDDETDMKKLEEAVRSVEIEGLLWGASKLVPVGYGIKKMTIMLTIVEYSVVDRVSSSRTVLQLSPSTNMCRVVTLLPSTKSRALMDCHVQQFCFHVGC
ncbi:elongation factor 1-beta-like protein [Tanacetum coccineum]